MVPFALSSDGADLLGSVSCLCQHGDHYPVGLGPEVLLHLEDRLLGLGCSPSRESGQGQGQGDDRAGNDAHGVV